MRLIFAPFWCAPAAAKRPADRQANAGSCGVVKDLGVSEERREEDGRQTKMNARHWSCRGIVSAFALIVWLSCNVLAQQKPFLVLDIYAKAVTAVERDPLVPMEQDLAKGREPEIPKGFSHLITETFPLKPDPQPDTDLDISLIYAPEVADRPRITAPALLKFRDIPLHPPQNARMGQGDARPSFGRDRGS